LYLTVHELERHHLGQAFESLSARGLPAVRGELAEPDAPGYHYCPGRDQAVDWFGQQGLAIADESFRRENGWGYRHFLLRTGPGCAKVMTRSGTAACAGATAPDHQQAALSQLRSPRRSPASRRAGIVCDKP
jgi:hypothetical protein